jgi:hypothetical protein
MDMYAPMLSKGKAAPVRIEGVFYSVCGLFAFVIVS